MSRPEWGREKGDDEWKRVDEEWKDGLKMGF